MTIDQASQKNGTSRARPVERVRGTHDRLSTELERAEADARDKLAKLKTASAEGWAEFRRGVDKAVEDVQAGWKRFKAEKLD